MTSSAIEAEFEASFESDKKAFDSLSLRDRKIVSNIAAAGFGVRRGVVAVGDLVVTAMETAFNIFVRAPAVFLWRQAEKVADGMADAPARLAAAIRRGGLALQGKAFGLWGGGVRLLNRMGIINDESRDARLERIARVRQNLEARRTEIAARSQERREKAKARWRATKRKIGSGLARVGGFLEYNVAIGLYRGFKWLLDPRRPNGKPLLGNEKLNKAVGVIAATVMFGVLAYQLSKIGVLAKILHVKLAHAAVTDGLPIYLTFLKQAVLQPAITVGLTALKFVTLPVIAAARGRMKTTDFTQGVAYAYKRKLRDHQEEKLKREFNKTAKYKPNEDDPKWVEFRKKAVIAARKKSFGFIRSFFHHIVEKASPEFYEVRHRHYEDLHATRKNRQEEKKAVAQQKAAKPAVYEPFPTLPRGPIAPGIGKDFGDAQKPPAEPKKPAPPLVPPAPALP